MKTTRWALLLALLGTASHGAEVYRSTDANGVPSFSDRPGENSETVFIATPRPGRAAVAPAQRPAAAQQPAANAARPATQQAAAPGQQSPQQTPAERTAERVKNCGLARERSTRYENSARLFRTTPTGEREYLTDGEIDEAKARAAADVATWCD
jgi:hypothetical protein